MKYLVQFEQSTQVTEDSWRIQRPSLEVHADRPLIEVLKWAIRANNGKMPEKIEIRELNTLS